MPFGEWELCNTLGYGMEVLSGGVMKLLEKKTPQQHDQNVYHYRTAIRCHLKD